MQFWPRPRQSHGAAGGKLEAHKRTSSRSAVASLPASRTSHCASAKWPKMHAFSSAVLPFCRHDDHAARYQCHDSRLRRTR
jgi:hypothetical protein